MVKLFSQKEYQNHKPERKYNFVSQYSKLEYIEDD